MSIMSKIFGGLSSAPAPVQAQLAVPPVQQQSTPGNIPANNPAPATANNPLVPAASETVMTTPLSELDKFKDLWAPEDPTKAPAAPDSMFAGVTMDKVQASAKNNDFLKAVTPEMMTAIAAGGEGAVQATLAAMNAMAQKGFGDSAFATTKIVEQALEKQRTQFEAMLPNLMKNQNVAERLRTENPIFNHPAASPILDMFTKQVAQKFPNATAAEQQAMAQDYVIKFAEAANPPKQSAASKKAAASETDWDAFMG